MTDAEILVPLKVDIGISTSALDGYLATLVASASNYIATEGITINREDISDCNLIEMYAAFLYRSRKKPELKMPRSLRWALNNRLMHEKGSLE